MDKDTVLLFTRNGLGHADQALQHRLATTFFSLINEYSLLPGKICFYTDGVRLACEGSPILDALHSLEAGGVELIICRTCLETFGLLDRVRVGVVGGMTDIVEALAEADKVVSL